jgi:hypothetical protein
MSRHARDFRSRWSVANRCFGGGARDDLRVALAAEAGSREPTVCTTVSASGANLAPVG